MSPETALSRQREDRALELRIAGKSFGAIAEALGYSGAGGAHKAVARALERTQNSIFAHADEWRRLEVARLEKILAGLEPGVSNGDPAAANAAIRVSERLSKLLGLDAPAKTELSGPNGGPVVTADATVLARFTDDELEQYERLCQRVIPATPAED